MKDKHEQTYLENKESLESKYFALTHGILMNSSSNELIFAVLKILENVQFLYFVLSLQIISEWNSNLIVYPNYLINYISFDYLFKNNP